MLTGCRLVAQPFRACVRITLNAKIAKRAKHLFERFFLCGLSGLCVDVISSHPLTGCATVDILTSDRMRGGASDHAPRTNAKRAVREASSSGGGAPRESK